MEGNHLLAAKRFSTSTCQLRKIQKDAIFESLCPKIIYEQQVANMMKNANEVVRFLKNVRNYFFFWKKCIFREKILFSLASRCSEEIFENKLWRKALLK